jgi:hypothetical protein
MPPPNLNPSRPPGRSSSTGIRLLAVVADLHCGSTYGLLPPGFETLEGTPVGQNPVQRWLWDCWTDATEQWLPSIVGNDPWALAVNGDATDGNHHGTTEIVSPATGDHCTAAEAVLKPLAEKAAKRFITEGTECHTKNIEHDLARAIGATPDPDRPPKSKKLAWDRLDLTIAGTRCILQHHITTTSRAWLEASALSIHLANEQIEAARNGETLPSVLGCAHRHRFGEYRDASGLAFVTPPWQMLTRYARKVVPSARTRPGMVILDWRGLPDGSLPRLHASTYRPPQATGVTL